ncbi:hypothetical protein GJ744_005505 [Endocarpon pusillum]|uniref:Senescence domain-containing protein n=1 Tax=Endocarpon pusillum TaxID=364733 RepID=A0A8H7AMM9_9EURO|nr:hypothetical protein GJ744_005505 [Endocarpon pusillum]
MSSGHSEPQVLYSINGIRAYHIQDGEEQPLNPSGPQTLSLLMVPTSSPFTDLSSTEPTSAAPEEDFYLHLHLPPELDLPLPATTQVFHQPPSSYIIPMHSSDRGALTRIEFPPIGRRNSPGKVTQEDVDTFETILAQCTAFLERASPPKGHEHYNPAHYAPGQGHAGTGDSKARPGQIVIVDEENGSVVGELQEGFNVVESSTIRPGSKNPVEIHLPAEGQGNNIQVNNVSDEYLQMSRHPAYQESTIVQTSATASRLIVTGSTYLANAINSGADSFQKKTKPSPKPMTFTPATHARIRKINNFSQGAVGLSAKTVGQVSRYAQNIGAGLTGKGSKKVGYDKDGNPASFHKPGILNKSMIAFSTIADGIDQAGRQLLQSGSSAATTVVGHRYGDEARSVASDIGGGVRNVGLVYIDAAGVSRKAVIKSVAKGMVVGKMQNGQHLVVGAGDGGVAPQAAGPQSQGGYPSDMKHTGNSQNLYGGSSSGKPGTEPVGFGTFGTNPAPPTYESGVGEGLYGQYAPEKH